MICLEAREQLQDLRGRNDLPYSSLQQCKALQPAHRVLFICVQEGVFARLWYTLLDSNWMGIERSVL